VIDFVLQEHQARSTADLLNGLIVQCNVRSRLGEGVK
jgi:hypothetical protein